jgi:hypothetical protein
MDLAKVLRLKGEGLEAVPVVTAAIERFEAAGDPNAASEARAVLEDIRTRPNPGPEEPGRETT